ncbi:hypothetical protein [Oleisolibacter albus]|uniref:hypothetical protein n=1 Tax=Oleisolibacter albus TaxID=2171757 RepID=UPI000DF132AF|nr:hypothetical protein [Oleisolibacter albus]
MRLLTAILLLLALLFAAPGPIHAADAPHSHGQSADDGAVTDGGSTKSYVDCHHGCGHVHVADRLGRPGVLIEWTALRLLPEDALLPQGAEPGLPYEPPRL